MRAIVHDRYGPPTVLRVANVDPPVSAEDDGNVVLTLEPGRS